MQGFLHLHSHSEHSALDGLSTVNEMVLAVAADDQPALAVTDHGNCAAHPHLQKAALDAGINPIFGMEAYFVNDRHDRSDRAYWHLVLWAQDNEGLKNLWGMSTEANREGFYGKPRLDWDTLSRLNKGVMCSTACLSGPVSSWVLKGDDYRARQAAGRLKDIFGDRLYVELHTNQLDEQHKVNLALVQMAQELHLPFIAVSDSHYPTREFKQTHKVWMAAQTNKDLQDDQDMFAGDHDYHLMTAAEARAALSYLPGPVVEQALAKTLEVADRCNARILPVAGAPIYSKQSDGGVAADQERLVERCLKAWPSKLNGKPQPPYIERFDREMKLLTSKKLCGYFLMVSDYCTWAKDSGILVGPGRGSGVASLVAYLAGITEVDPIEANLLFERFLTEGRMAMPDFDIDFPASKRDELQDYIRRRYGEESVVRVGTSIKLKNKGVVRDLARVLKSTIEIDYPDIDAVSNIITEAEASSAGLGIPWEQLWTEHAEVLAPYREKYPQLFAYADQMVGRLKTYGKHAAGVVISLAGALTDLPMRKADDEMVSEFDMDALELMGLIKFDLLTLRTLDTVQMTVDMIHEKYGDQPLEGGFRNIYEWREEYNDPDVWGEIGKGYTLGVFQIETKAGTKLAKRMKPRSVAELADMITIVRPGPDRSGLTEMYLRRREGREGVSYPDPRLEHVLSRSYGVLMYQEDIMATCMILGGYTAEEADEVRKILGKKKVEKTEAEGKRFVERCVARGMAEQAAKNLWGQMATFALYAFNKAHAYAYATLGYWCAWLRFHYPVEFLTAALSSVDKKRIPEFVHEVRRLDYQILPPDVNKSTTGFSISLESAGHTVRYGLDSIKGIGPAAVEAIVQGQPYTSWDDFLERRGTACNWGVIKTLARIGAFDSLRPNRRQLEMELEYRASGEAERCSFKDVKVTGPNDLPCRFDWASEPVQIGKKGFPLKAKPIPKKCTKACRNYSPIGAPTIEVSNYTDEEIRNREFALLGVYLSSTPFSIIKEEARDIFLDAHGIEEAPIQNVADEYKTPLLICGLIQKVRPYTTVKGKDMGFLTVFVQTGDVDMVVFNEEWLKYRADLKPQTLFIAHIIKTRRGLTLQTFMPL